MKPISKTVFRAYDIRGVVDEDFDAQWVHRLGLATGTYFRDNGWTRALVCHDVRPSSPSYCQAMTAGLREAGVDVVLLGQGGTPLFYFAVRHLGFQAGVMITASHNPPQYNGFKMWGGKTVLSPGEIAELYDIFEAGKFTSGNGLASTHDALPAYLDELAGGMDLPRPVKVVVDGGNGTSGEITATLLERCGAEVVRLYCDPHPDFPNHHPDPVVEENMTDLKARVVAEGADLGIGLDGDGDRMGLVDEKGNLLTGDRLACIIARQTLLEQPGATIMGDVKCSHVYFKDITQRGGTPVMGITGHSIMKAKMLETGAAFAGEFSGHMFFGGRFKGADDATWAALKVTSMAAASDAPVSEWLADWPQLYSTWEIHRHCPDEQKFAVIRRVTAVFREMAGQIECEIIDLDGVRVVYKDGWGLIRASNTQPVLVLRFEAESEARLSEIQATMETALEKHLTIGLEG